MLSQLADSSVRGFESEFEEQGYVETSDDHHEHQDDTYRPSVRQGVQPSRPNRLPHRRLEGKADLGEAVYARMITAVRMVSHE